MSMYAINYNDTIDKFNVTIEQLRKEYKILLEFSKKNLNLEIAVSESANKVLNYDSRRKSEERQTLPIGFAVFIRNPSLVKSLVNAGANVNVGSFRIKSDGTSEDSSPLCHANRSFMEYYRGIHYFDGISQPKEGLDECVSILAKAGCDITKSSNIKQSCSMMALAASNNDVEMIKSLVNAKADVNSKTYAKGNFGDIVLCDPYTPLQILFLEGLEVRNPYHKLSTVQALVELGADLFAELPKRIDYYKPLAERFRTLKEGSTILDLAKHVTKYVYSYEKEDVVKQQVKDARELIQYLEDQMTLCYVKSLITLYDQNVPLAPINIVYEYLVSSDEKTKISFNDLMTQEIKERDHVKIKQCEAIVCKRQI